MRYKQYTFAFIMFYNQMSVSDILPYLAGLKRHPRPLKAARRLTDVAFCLIPHEKTQTIRMCYFLFLFVPVFPKGPYVTPKGGQHTPRVTYFLFVPVFLKHPYVTPKGGQDAPRVTSYLTKLRVGQCLTVLLHRDSNNIRFFFYIFYIYFLQKIITIIYNTKDTCNSLRASRGKDQRMIGDFTLTWLG